jgi:CTP:molybdopterin cytidylyltransferase MocA
VPTEPDVTGLVLAAGAGTRRGGPKALVVDANGSWLALAVHVLLDGGCRSVVVVLGAAVDEARPHVPQDARVTSIHATDWAHGMSASLRAGLTAATGDVVVVTLVDLPDTPASVVHRLVEHADRTTLRQAVYGGRPGHPVVLGADHWQPLHEHLTGDTGARPYLRSHGVHEIECGDLHHGRDQDT